MMFTMLPDSSYWVATHEKKRTKFSLRWRSIYMRSLGIIRSPPGRSTTCVVAWYIDTWWPTSLKKATMERSLDADESESTIKRIWLRLGEMCRKPSPSRGPAFDCSFLQELIWMTFKKKIWFTVVTTSLQLISFMDIFRFWENQHLKMS